MKKIQTAIKLKSSFKEVVLQVVKSIPRGKTLSYGEVARLVGRPNAARAVGTIMARNTDKKVPCHRVVRVEGGMGGYNGLRGGRKGSKAKLKLLRSEGAM